MDSNGSLIVNLDDVKFLKGITTIHWNCRSLFFKMDEVYLMVTQSNCEICILSESWLTTAVSDVYIAIDGYKAHLRRSWLKSSKNIFVKSTRRT